MSQSQFILSLVCLSAAVGIGLTFLMIKDIQDAKRQRTNERESERENQAREKFSRDLANEIFLECPTTRPRLSNSFISENGIVLLPDNYYPYDGTA
jgi:hypothetical protein